MSGFEIAGVILGSLPLIISAMEHYKEIKGMFGRARRYQIELGRIKQDLVAESVIFRDTLEHVLHDLVAPSQYEKLLHDPSSGLWKDAALNEALKQRLDGSYTIFMDSVTSMNTTIRDFMEMLDLDDQGKIRWADGNGFRSFVKKAQFSTRKNTFDAQTKLLEHHNRHLRKITKRSIQFELFRKKRELSSRPQKTSQYATCIFHALEASFGCNCKGPDTHTALFGIYSQSAFKKSDSNTDADFQIVISGVDQGIQTTKKNKTMHWQEMVLQADGPSSGNGNVHHSSQKEALPTHVSHQGRNTIVPTSSQVRLISSPSTNVLSITPLPGATTSTRTTTMTTTQSTAPILQPKALDLSISNLCEIICTSKAKVMAPRYVTDGSRKFLLHQIAHSSSLDKTHWSTISLRQILERSNSSVPRLTPWDRLALAAAVSSAVAQLYCSPWLKPMLNNENLLFLRREGQRIYSEAFVAKHMLDLGKTGIQHTETPIFDNTLLALAFILVELCLGPLEKLQTQEDLRAGIFADLVTASRLVANDHIQDEFGPHYQSAIGRCLDLAKITKVWDEKVQQEFHEGVVSVLEDQAKRRPSEP